MELESSKQQYTGYLTNNNQHIGVTNTMGKYIFFGVLALVGILLISTVFNVIAWSNDEIALRQQVLAQQKVNTTIFDKMWKVISQQAQVSDKYKDSFKEVYQTIMSERYENAKNVTWQWLQESNPQFSSALFERVMVSIEANRNEFALEQKKLIDIGRSHTVMVSQFPGSLWASLLGRSPIDLKIVTSEKTEKAFSTGREDSVRVY